MTRSKPKKPCPSCGKLIASLQQHKRWCTARNIVEIGADAVTPIQMDLQIAAGTGNLRQATHGDFTKHALLTQLLKRDMRFTDSWDSLPSVAQEALEMIAHKMARIITGLCSDPEHWRDIAGYATLAKDKLTPRKPTRE